MPTSHPQSAYSVRELHQALAGALRQGFPEPVAVRGLVSGWKTINGDFVVFILMDEEEYPVRLQGLIPTNSWRSLAPALKGADLPDQTAVTAWGRPSLQARSGVFRLLIQGMQVRGLPRAAQRQQVLECLRAEGTLQRNQRLTLAEAPLRIGLIAPEGSAGLADFLHELKRSGVAFQVRHLPCPLGGAQASGLLARALGVMADQPLDAVVVCRGGGERCDLAAFDQIEPARAVCLCRAPVITGVGHQTDVSVVDEVAYRALITPTAAARFLVEKVLDSWRDMRRQGRQVMGVLAAKVLLQAGHRLDQARDAMASRGLGQLDSVTARLQAMPAALVSLRRFLTSENGHVAAVGVSLSRAQGPASVSLAHHGSLVVMASRNHLAHEAAAPGQAVALAVICPRALAQINTRILALSGELARKTKGGLNGRLQGLEAAARVVAQADPQLQLKRGLVLARDVTGQVIKEAARLQPGQRLNLQFRDGQAVSRVESTDPRKGD